MGKENLGYEPIEALFKNGSIDADIKVFPVRTIISYEERDQGKENMCWLPVRLNTNHDLKIKNIRVKKLRDNSICINKGLTFIDDNQTIYILVGTDENDLCLYLKLKLVRENKINYITHYDGLESNLSIYQKYKDIKEIKIEQKPVIIGTLL